MFLQIQKQKPYFVPRGYRTPPQTFRQIGALLSTRTDNSSVKHKSPNKQVAQKSINDLPTSRKKYMVDNLKEMLSKIMKKERQQYQQHLKEQSQINKNYRIENKAKKDQALLQLKEYKKSLYKMYKHNCTTEIQPCDWKYLKQQPLTQRKLKKKMNILQHHISKKNIMPFSEQNCTKKTQQDGQKKYYTTQIMNTDTSRKGLKRRQTLINKNEKSKMTQQVQQKIKRRKKNTNEKKNKDKTYLRLGKKTNTNFKNKLHQNKLTSINTIEHQKGYQQESDMQLKFPEDYEDKIYRKIKRQNCRKGSSKQKGSEDLLDKTIKQINFQDQSPNENANQISQKQNVPKNDTNIPSSRNSEIEKKVFNNSFIKKNLFKNSTEMKASQIFKTKQSQEQINDKQKHPSARFYMSRYAKQKLFFSINNNDIIKKIKPSQKYSHQFSFDDNAQTNEHQNSQFQKQYLEKIMNRLDEKIHTSVLSENFSEFIENIFIDDEDEDKSIQQLSKKQTLQAIKTLSEDKNMSHHTITFKNSLRKAKQLIKYNQPDPQNNRDEQFSYDFFIDIENYLQKKSLISYPLKTIKYQLCKFLKQFSFKQNILFKNYAFYMYLQSSLNNLHKKLEKIQKCEKNHQQENSQIISLVNSLHIADDVHYYYNYEPFETQNLQQIPINHFKNQMLAKQISTWLSWDIENKNQTDDLKQKGFTHQLLSEQCIK